jgi:hypothetical protein
VLLRHPMQLFLLQNAPACAVGSHTGYYYFVPIDFSPAKIFTCSDPMNLLICKQF